MIKNCFMFLIIKKCFFKKYFKLFFIFFTHFINTILKNNYINILKKLRIKYYTKIILKIG